MRRRPQGFLRAFICVRLKETLGLFGRHLDPLKLAELPLRRLLHRAQVPLNVSAPVLLVLKRLVVVAVVRLCFLDVLPSSKVHPPPDRVVRHLPVYVPLVGQFLDQRCGVSTTHVLWNECFIHPLRTFHPRKPPQVGPHPRPQLRLDVFITSYETVVIEVPAPIRNELATVGYVLQGPAINRPGPCAVSTVPACYLRALDYFFGWVVVVESPVKVRHGLALRANAALLRLGHPRAEALQTLTHDEHGLERLSTTLQRIVQDVLVPLPKSGCACCTKFRVLCAQSLADGSFLLAATASTMVHRPALLAARPPAALRSGDVFQEQRVVFG